MSAARKHRQDSTLCVLVADEAIAKLMVQPKPGAELVEMQALADPQAHARESEHHRDAHGRRQGGERSGARGLGGNATTSAGDSDRHLEAGRFAKTVAAELGKALREQRFDRLRIVAAPRFLGLLRKELSPQVAAAVSDDAPLDIVKLPVRELTQRLFPAPAAQP